MTKGFINISIYLSLKFVEFLLNIVYSVYLSVLFLIKIILSYIFDINMIATTKNRNKTAPVATNPTVALRGVINANWHKLLSSNLISDVKKDWAAPKDHFEGTFRRSRQKKNKNESKDDLSFEPKEAVVFDTDSQCRKAPSNCNKNKLTKFIAMDCEMVGIGYDGNDHMLARVSIVNKFGDCIYDKFVKPREEVMNYRTEVSGVRKEDLINAEEFAVVQKEVAELLRGRILVGHSLKNDLGVLFLAHPKRNIRDTSRYKPFKKITKGSTPSLKRLAKEILGIDIQSGEHSSVEDARAAMQLYCTVAKKWESGMNTKSGHTKLPDE